MIQRALDITLPSVLSVGAPALPRGALPFQNPVLTLRAYVAHRVKLIFWRSQCPDNT